MAGPCLTDGQSLFLQQLDDGSLTGEVITSPSAQSGAIVTASGLYVPNRPVESSALPTLANHLDEIVVIPDLSDTSRRWYFAFDEVSGKWGFSGGSPLRAVGGDGNRNSHADVWGVREGGPGPDLQLPLLPGKFLIEWGFKGAGNGSGEMYMSPKYSAAEATTGIAAQNNATTLASVYAEAELIIDPAANAGKIQSRFRNSDTTGTALFNRTWIRATPVYLG